MTILLAAGTPFGDHRTIAVGPPLRRHRGDGRGARRAVERGGRPGDVVRHPGDVARRGADAPGPLARLNGTKRAIRGNTDPDATLAAAGRASVGARAAIGVAGRRLVPCHYPFRTWNGQHRGAINLQHDIGVDAPGRDFAPVPLARG